MTAARINSAVPIHSVRLESGICTSFHTSPNAALLGWISRSSKDCVAPGLTLDRLARHLSLGREKRRNLSDVWNLTRAKDCFRPCLRPRDAKTCRTRGVCDQRCGHTGALSPQRWGGSSSKSSRTRTRPPFAPRVTSRRLRENCGSHGSGAKPSRSFGPRSSRASPTRSGQSSSCAA